MKRADSTLKTKDGHLLFPIARKGQARMYQVTGADVFFVSTIYADKDEFGLTAEFLLEDRGSWQDSGKFFTDEKAALEMFEKLGVVETQSEQQRRETNDFYANLAK